MKYIYFDFDGTIADSLALGLDIADELSEKYGFEKVDRTKLDEYKKMTATELFKELRLPFIKVPIIAPMFKIEINRKINDLHPFDGIKDLMHKLSEDNYLGILTSNSVENVKKFLINHNMIHLFSDIRSEIQIFGKHLSLNKIIRQNKISKADFVYIGDETRDIEAANKTKVKSIAVTWGFNHPDVLIKYQPTYIAKEPNDILNIINSL